MTRDEQYQILQYQYELLRTRLRIREHYLGTAVKEVYENIGQVLSLIRIKLLGLHQATSGGSREELDNSGELVGQTISDLRKMCRLFYPEEEIVNGAGFHKVMAREIKSRIADANYLFDETLITPRVLQGEKGLILFGILLEIVGTIETEGTGKLVLLTSDQQADRIRFLVDYRGEKISWRSGKANALRFSMGIAERTKLLGGRLKLKSNQNENRRIILDLPIK